MSLPAEVRRIVRCLKCWLEIGAKRCLEASRGLRSHYFCHFCHKRRVSELTLHLTRLHLVQKPFTYPCGIPSSYTFWLYLRHSGKYPRHLFLASYVSLFNHPYYNPFHKPAYDTFLTIRSTRPPYVSAYIPAYTIRDRTHARCTPFLDAHNHNYSYHYNYSYT